MIAVPPALFHEQETGIQQSSKVRACGLRGDSGMTCKFARGQRPTIHEGIKHTCPAWISDQGSDLGQGVGAEHNGVFHDGGSMGHKRPSMLRPFA